MTKRLFLAALALLPLAAQPARGPMGNPPLKSPDVAADGRVTFRFRAPKASEVAVTGLGPRLVMQKDEQGVWSATTAEPLKPEIYTYAFQVDGATVYDPANPHSKTSFGAAGQSLLHVPGPGPNFARPGPRGAVTRHFYRSAVAGDDRDFYVYTPPNYDPKANKSYPVLFLLHGLGDEAAGWLNVGAANVILDNLINEGKAKPMIMVNTLGYGNSEGPRGAMQPTMIPNFAKTLVTEVLPQVEKHYRVSTRREDRAIAGLSMGGAEAVYTGLNNLDRFAYVASFSGAFVMWPRASAAGQPRAPVGNDDFAKNFPALDAKSASKLKLLWIGCGLDDGLIAGNRQFKEWLKSKDIASTGPETPAYGHVWPLWRIYLAEIAPLLF